PGLSVTERVGEENFAVVNPHEPPATHCPSPPSKLSANEAPADGQTEQASETDKTRQASKLGFA
ncbi:MAG TPA: hypothetical protein P5038_06625, partial [Candidatus Paceibacterota bacterium]|nr:hypothetical protein [Candidatus Paceibacterota bacterium]